MLYSIVGLLVIILDQAVKYWVQNTLFGTDIVKFIPGARRGDDDARRFHVAYMRSESAVEVTLFIRFIDELIRRGADDRFQLRLYFERFCHKLR